MRLRPPSLSLSLALSPRYDGKWVAGARCGRGRCVYAAGHSYDGVWAAGAYDGEGTYTHAARREDQRWSWRGVWKAGQRAGYGVLLDARGGARAHGVWDGDECVEAYDVAELAGFDGSVAPSDDGVKVLDAVSIPAVSVDGDSVVSMVLDAQ